MDKERNYAIKVKPLLKRMYKIEDERKRLNKEFREIAQTIKSLNLYLIKDEK